MWNHSMHRFISHHRVLGYSTLLLSMLSANAHADWLFAAPVFTQPVTLERTTTPQDADDLILSQQPEPAALALRPSAWQLTPKADRAAQALPEPESATPGLRF
jgi:hypothetical protein